MAIAAERGLEFPVGEQRLVIPADKVERVVESVIASPPPLSREWIGGLGTHAEGVFVVVDLTGAPRDKAACACVLLDKATSPDAQRWAVRVSGTGRFVQVRRGERSSLVPSSWPSWIVGGSDETGLALALLDVDGMVRDYTR